MIPKDKINDVLSTADLLDVAGSCGVRLRKSGAVLYKARCPFHDEKDGSFFINTKYNRFRCYGCEKSGNAIDFLMELKGYSFVEAVRTLAAKYSITIEERTLTKEEERQEKIRQQQSAVYEEAARFYEQCLKDTPEALEYAQSRFNSESIEAFRIGYAPSNTSALYDHLRKKGIAFDVLEQCDLFRKRKDLYITDFFRDRLMFPIFNISGKVIAFSGRALHLEEGTPKYINSGENALYSKGATLFGMNFAFRHIRNTDMAVLVEGNADVVKMHQLGVCNVVAPCGTSLTDEQIRLLVRASKNVTLMLDGDDAGRAATERNGRRLIQSGLNVYLLEIPSKPDGTKQDPDSFFSSKEQFEEFQTSNKRFLLNALAEAKSAECVSDPSLRARTVRDISSLFADRPAAERESLIDGLAQIIPGKTLWRQALKDTDEQTRRKAEEEKAKERHTAHGKTEEQEALIRKYGFYTEKNCYFFYSLKGDNFYKGSNFTMEPLFHIESTLNAKRLYRLKNTYGVVQVLEFSQKDLISIAAFKLRCESLGNFLFDGGEHGLGKIKAYLYDNTKTCKEVTQLGWQKQGFFAWANGITTPDGAFQPVNELGIAEHKGKYYYLPALSSFYTEEDTLFQFERKFIHRSGEITLFDFTDWLLKVYNDNAIAGIGFYFATIFRDIIISHYRFFPILNIFGPKGTGKSEMAVTLLKLFGDLPVGINMTNSTVPAMADHVAHTRNALCHIDEYKNSLDFEKIEFLKGLWDGVGRSRMNMEKDRKKEMTAVDAGIMLTGQEMATADNALFSRVIFLSVSKTEFSQAERERFDELKRIEKQGLTHITNRLLKLREKFLSGYVAAFDETISDISMHIDKRRIEDRILKNWCIVLAAIKIVEKEEELPFSYEKAVRTFAQMLTRQNGDVIAGNEVSDFWNTYQELFSNGTIEKDFDFQIKEVDELKTNTETYNKSIKVLFMNPNRIFGLYAQQKRSANEKRLPKDTLQYYLKNSNAYLGLQQKRFRRNMKNLQDRESVRYVPGDGTVALEYERPYAWCFDYTLLSSTMNLNLETDYMWEQKDEVKPLAQNGDENAAENEKDKEYKEIKPNNPTLFS